MTASASHDRPSRRHGPWTGSSLVPHAYHARDPENVPPEGPMLRTRLRRVRRRLGLTQPSAQAQKPMDPASVMSRRRVFETLPDVPACPEGWRTGAPDFVIFGAQKSGTTWWFRLIEQHPDVVQPPKQRPELHFFDRLWGTWPNDELIGSLPPLLPSARGQAHRREDARSTCPAHGRRRWSRWPHLRRERIVLLRDPVERYVSGLSHQDRGGLIDEAEVEGRATDLRGSHAGRHRRDRPRPVRDPARLARWRRTRRSGCSSSSTSAARRCRRPALANVRSSWASPPHRLPAEELARPRNMAKLEKLDVPAEHLELLRRYYRPEVERLRDRDDGPRPVALAELLRSRLTACPAGARLDLATDRRELLGDRAAQEDQGEDGQDGDQCQDECVLSERLTRDRRVAGSTGTVVAVTAMPLPPLRTMASERLGPLRPGLLRAEFAIRMGDAEWVIRTMSHVVERGRARPCWCPTAPFLQRGADRREDAVDLDRRRTSGR